MRLPKAKQERPEWQAAAVMDGASPYDREHQRPAVQTVNVTSSVSTIGFDLASEYFAPPSLGINTITALEANGNAASVNVNVTGIENCSVLSAVWRG